MRKLWSCWLVLAIVKGLRVRGVCKWTSAVLHPTTTLLYKGSDSIQFSAEHSKAFLKIDGTYMSPHFPYVSKE